MAFDPWTPDPLKKFREIFSEYEDATPSDKYLRLYEGDDVISLGLASLHEELDRHIKFMNGKAPNGSSGHFNAENSRELISLIGEINSLKSAVRRAGSTLTLEESYEKFIDSADDWLIATNGSPIPAGLTPIEIKRHEPVFVFGEETVLKIDQREDVALKMEGEGSFARVHSFEDPAYGIKFARKTLKKGASEDDTERFRKEFEIMSNLSFPYILQVYKYDHVKISYTMEYCENTLHDYVKERNGQDSFDMATRRRVALQFLHGLNYLHLMGFSHRDLSYKNILLKRYGSGAVVVKLSDFGLVKDHSSDYTRTGVEIAGSIVDPALRDFKEYAPINDIYAAGFILSYIFGGRQNLMSDGSAMSKIVHKCSHTRPEERYKSVLEIVDALDGLDFSAEGVSA